jgi:hypothetical protein
MKRSLLCVLVALLLCFSLMPKPALAQTTTTTPTQTTTPITTATQLTVYFACSSSSSDITASGIPYAPGYTTENMAGTRITGISVTPASYVTDAATLYGSSPVSVSVTLTVNTDAGTYRLPVTVQVDYSFYGTSPTTPAVGNVFFWIRTCPPGPGNTPDITSADAVFHVQVNAGSASTSPSVAPASGQTSVSTSSPSTSAPPAEPFPYWILLAVVILVLLVGSIAYMAGRRMGRRSSGVQAPPKGRAKESWDRGG